MWQSHRTPPPGQPSGAIPPVPFGAKPRIKVNATRRTSRPYPLNRRGLRSRILALVHAALLITLNHFVTQPIYAQTTFGPQRIITTEADGANKVYAADLDGDGDIDVLSASSQDNKIAWYENTDGAGGFGPQQVITTAANEATSIYAADLDGDGDIDVLSASFFDDRIVWYENLIPLKNTAHIWLFYQ